MSLLLLLGGTSTPIEDALLIDSGDVLGEVLHGSLRLSLNTLDFVLTDPASVPAIDDTVELDMFGVAYWTGTVSMVEDADFKGTHTYVTVTATNTEVAEVVAGPFGLSDTPDGSTTFGYRNLKVKRTKTTTGTETSVTCEMFEPGLAPGMTIELTSVNQGFSAEEFTVDNLRMSWPTADDPVWELELGDPIATLSAWVDDAATNATGDALDDIFPIDDTYITDGAITTPKLAANAVTAAKITAGTITATELASGSITTPKLALVDASGTTLLDASGFGPTWQRFIHGGVYNGDFLAPAQSLVADLDNSTNILPGWTYQQVTGTTITARCIADTDSATGHSVRFSFASGTSGDKTFVEQIVPIQGALAKARAFSFSYTWRGDGSSLPANFFATAYIQALKADGTTTTGSENNYGSNAVTANTNGIDVNAVIQPPEDAAFLRIRVGARRAVTNGTTASYRLMAVTLESQTNIVILNDASDATSTKQSAITQVSNNLQVVADYGATSPTIELRGGTGHIFITPATGSDVYLPTGGIAQYDGDTFNSYTPTVTNGGTATYSTQTGWYQVIGKMVFVGIEIVINSAGSGGGTITIDLPSTPAGTNQVIVGYCQGFTTFGTSGAVVGLANTAGSTLALIKDYDGTSLLRSHFASSAILRMTGWYRAA